MHQSTRLYRGPFLDQNDRFAVTEALLPMIRDELVALVDAGCHEITVDEPSMSCYAYREDRKRFQNPRFFFAKNGHVRKRSFCENPFTGLRVLPKMDMSAMCIRLEFFPAAAVWPLRPGCAVPSRAARVLLAKENGHVRKRSFCAPVRRFGAL